MAWEKPFLKSLEFFMQNAYKTRFSDMRIQIEKEYTASVEKIFCIYQF